MFFCINFTTLMELRFLLAFWPGNCIWQAFSSCWLCRRRNTWKCWWACPERSRSIFRGILCYSWKRHVLDRRKNRRRTGEIPNISGHKPRLRCRISGCDPLLWREWAIRYYVLPEYRRKGYGRKLLAKALDCNQPRGMMLLVETDNTAAIRLYELMNFKTVPGQNSLTAHWQIPEEKEIDFEKEMRYS